MTPSRTHCNLTIKTWDDYELLDSGGGQKWERYGPYRFIRPEPQAMWSPDRNNWNADGAFIPGTAEDEGRWRINPNVPKRWDMAWENIKFHAQCTPFRHLAFFPEQAMHWEWMVARIAACKSQMRVLNLFGYTGIASLICAAAGAEVTHVDASRKAIAFAQDNQKLSALENRPIRWIVDDALKFTAREVRRGRKYHAIILDPPKFGRGPKKETWHLFEDLPSIMTLLPQLISEDPAFMVLTTYAIRASNLAFAQLVAGAFPSARIEYGEMLLPESTPRRLAVPMAHYVRATWK